TSRRLMRPRAPACPKRSLAREVLVIRNLPLSPPGRREANAPPAARRMPGGGGASWLEPLAGLPETAEISRSSRCKRARVGGARGTRHGRCFSSSLETLTGGVEEL